MINFSDRELQKYQRQILIPEIGSSGQRKLKEARVTIAGAGGLGSAVAPLLTAAGVGEITIIDFDNVSLSNLNRQLLYTEEDLGKNKIELAVDKLKSLNCDVRIKGINEKIDDYNAERLLSGSKAIVDCLDNFNARFAINRAALKIGIPLFHGSCSGFEGHVTTIIPGKTPCLRCFIKKIPPVKITPVIGVTPALIGAIQAAEVIKYFTGTGELLAGTLLIFDGLEMKFEKVAMYRDLKCEFCGKVGTPGDS